jgi:dipeptidyl aminopeptidase/acylaminoacyl peptidase
MECCKSRWLEKPLPLKVVWRFARFISTLSLLWGIASPDAVKAQDVLPLPVEDALKVHEVSSYPFMPIGLSPDARVLVYAVQDNQRMQNVDENTYAQTGIAVGSVGADVWITNIETGEQRSLTGARGNNWSPIWSPDGHYVAFLSDRDGSGQARLWVWDAVKKDIRRVSDLNIRGLDQTQWTSDSRSLLVTTLPEGISPNDYGPGRSTRGDKQQLTGKTPNSGVDLYQSRASSKDEKKLPQSDPWNLDWRLDLVMIEVASGKTNTIVHNHRIQRYLLSPDGSRVAYTSPVRFEKPGSQQILFDLVVVAVATGQERVVASNIQLEIGGQEFRWSPDGSKLVYHIGGQEAANYDCYVVDADGGSSRNISFLPLPSHNHGSGVPLWDASGEQVYFLLDGALWRAALDGRKAIKLSRIEHHEITLMIPESDGSLWTTDGGKSTVVVTHDDKGVQDGFYKLDLASGNSSRLLERGQCYACTSGMGIPVVRGESDHQRLAYFAEDAQHDNEIWVSNAGFGKPRQVTHQNPQFEKHKMGSAKLIDWLSDDGERLHGTLLLPSDYREGNRYPLVVVVYGGGNLSHGFDRFGSWTAGAFNMQLLATRGYAILLPDSPQHTGTAMLDLAKTVLPGINKVIEMGVADPDRLGVMGQSNGGYSTLALIVQTKRFRAAIDIDGMGDLASDYGAMDKNGTAYGVGLLEHGQDAMGGTPWEFRERYVENSPVFYLDRVETPLLIVHGKEDTVVPPSQGDEIFIGLRRLGKEVEYAKYEGEGHSPLYWSYDHQVDFDNRMISWFDKYLKTKLEQ